MAAKGSNCSFKDIDFHIYWLVAYWIRYRKETTIRYREK